jgi:hypothetical protein
VIGLLPVSQLSRLLPPAWLIDPPRCCSRSELEQPVVQICTKNGVWVLCYSLLPSRPTSFTTTSSPTNPSKHGFSNEGCKEKLSKPSETLKH